MQIFKLALLALSLSAQAATPPPIDGTDLVTGKAAHVSVDQKGDQKKATVVVFLSAKCPCSNSHVDELTKLAKEYGDFNFVAVHSNTNESVEFSKTYFAAKALPFPVIQDDGAKLADRFKALKTPHAFIVKPDGELAYQGGMTNSADCSKADKHYLRDALEDLKQNRPVQQAVGRTLGCIIKRG